MDSNSIDDLINVIIENTEIDEDTARSCILDELALVDDLYKKEFFNEFSNTIYKGIGNNVTKVEDIVKASQDIQEKGDFITVAKAKQAKEAKENKDKSYSEEFVKELQKYKEELKAKTEQKNVEMQDGKIVDAFHLYLENILGINDYTEKYIAKLVDDIREFAKDSGITLSEDELKELAIEEDQGEKIEEAVEKVKTENGVDDEAAHKSVAIAQLIDGFIEYYWELDKSNVQETKAIHDILVELYKKSGKTERDLVRDLFREGLKSQKAGRREGNIGRESLIQEAKTYARRIEEGTSIDSIIEEKVDNDKKKVEMAIQKAKYEEQKETITNDPNLTEEERDEKLKDLKKSFFRGYKWSIQTLTSQYSAQTSEFEKALKRNPSEEAKAFIEKRIRSAENKRKLLEDIEPTHRIAMIFDLEKDVEKKINAMRKELEETKDDDKKALLQEKINHLVDNKASFKNDVRFEAIYGNKIDDYLGKTLISKRIEIDVLIAETTKQLEEARKKDTEINQREGVSEEEKKESSREVRKFELILAKHQASKERYQNDNVDEAFTVAEVYQLRRAFKKNEIRNSIRETKDQISTVVNKLKKLDPNSKEYIDACETIKLYRRDLKIKLMECGEGKESITQMMDSYSFVSSKDVFDVMYAETLNKVRSVSNSGLLIEQQGHTENKEMLYRIEECKKFSTYLSKKLCEISPKFSTEAIVARMDKVYEAFEKAEGSNEKMSFDLVIDKLEVNEEEKKLYAEILNGYLEDETDPKKRKAIVKRITYSPNYVPLRRATKYGIEKEKEKSIRAIKDEEMDEYFNDKNENIIVNEIIVTGAINHERTKPAEEQPQPVPLEAQTAIKPTPVQNNSVLAGITAGTKESERIAAESEYSKLNPEATKEDKSQEDKESENEETK